MSRCFITPLPPSPNATAEARDHVGRFLGDDAGPEHRDCAALVVSELVTNAVVHGRRPIELELTSDGSLVRIEVFDGDRDGGRVAERPSGTDDAHGRGLHVVAALAERWGVSTHDHGKAVWAELLLNGSSGLGPQAIGTGEE